jgi:tryptophan synthase alpha subunit
MTTGRERITSAIAHAAGEGRAALLVALPLSGQDPTWARRAVREVVDAGADMIEVQTRAPDHPKETIDLIAYAAQDVAVPVLLWTDSQTTIAFGVENEQPYRLVPECASAGVSGIATVVPPSLVDAWADTCRDDLVPVFFVSPNSNAEQMEASCRRGRGFLYGIGLKTSPPTDPAVGADLAAFAKRMRSESDLPLFVGAGVQTREQAALAGSAYDGVAIAKAVFDALDDASGKGKDPLDAAVAVVRSIRSGLVQAYSARLIHGFGPPGSHSGTRGN